MIEAALQWRYDMRTVLTLALVAILAGACASGGAEDPRDPLGQVLVAEAAEGFELVDGPASGPMDLTTAATATEISQTKVRRQLNRTGFQGGYSRVWRDGEDFVAAVVFGFLNAGRATELVTFHADELADMESVQPFSVPSIDGAHGFTLNARGRDGATLFCQIVWFAHDTHAFEVRICRTQPGSTEDVIELAQQQSALALGDG